MNGEKSLDLKAADSLKIQLGDFILCGYHVPQECRYLTERKTIVAETYWYTEKKLEANYNIQFIAIPERRCSMYTFGKETAHGNDSNVLFTSSWIPGEVYKIRFALEMPPIEKIANADLILELRIILNNKIYAVFQDPQKIKLHFPNKPYYNLDFPRSIYQTSYGQGWTAEQIAQITGGKWIVPPPKDFFVNKVSFCRNLIRRKTPHSLCFVTTPAERFRHKIHFQKAPRGMDEHTRLPEYAKIFSAAVISHSVKNLPADFPQLLVDDVIRAEFDLAFAARKIFQGKLIAVTDGGEQSATTAMTKRILSEAGFKVGATAKNYNISTGATSIFTNAAFSSAFAVIELNSTALLSPWGSITYGLKPHVAVITSTADENIEDVAKTKSCVFNGMEPGGYAILNRDMLGYEFIERRAKENFLKIINFGTHPESMIRMEKLQDGENFSFAGKTYPLYCPVPTNQIYDALAAIGVSVALGLSIETALINLASLQMPVEGRIFKTVYKNKNLRLIDGSVNATFRSIKAGLEYLNEVEKNPAARVAILGDIDNLGESAEKVHRQLADVILQINPDRVFLCGRFMKSLWQDIKDKCKCLWFESGQKLIPELDRFLQSGDCVFVKGSIPAKLKLVVNELTAQKI